MYRIFLLYKIICFTTCYSSNEDGVNSIYNNIFKAAHDNINENSTAVEVSPIFPDLRLLESTDSPNDVTARNISDDMEEYSNDTLNYTVPWNIFIAMLMQESIDQLTVIKNNINSIYQLGATEIRSVKSAFNNSEEDFENMILKKYKTIMKSQTNNNDKDFMLDFVEMAITFIQKIVSFNLNLVKGMLDSPTTWYHQKLRDKILRQQMKNTSNYIRFRVCKVLSICRDKTKYSDFALEWIRNVFALSKYELAEFFEIAPKVIQAHSDFIKSNVKFRQTLKYITVSSEIVQRDTLDFLDEAVGKGEKIYNKVPQALRPGAMALTRLFDIIDEFYQLHKNVSELEDISDILSMWSQQEINVFYVLDSIVKNMRANIAKWPKKEKENVEHVWYQITVL
ncbi:uncharacterized protein LOC128682857 [Plodia interpunctella]|uniref:uncharacterized protein LOC128682857 n=1 Tax=Plodia interpunctella TaxID=58824 RepID=UPI002367A3FF|nr:uncharacterized protein LOC128682857 [Plodia interpunctella]